MGFRTFAAMVSLLAGLAAALLGGLRAEALSSCSGKDCCISGSTNADKQCVRKDRSDIPEALRDRFRIISVANKHGDLTIGLASADGKKTLLKPQCHTQVFFPQNAYIQCSHVDGGIRLLTLDGREVKFIRYPGEIKDAPVKYVLNGMYNNYAVPAGRGFVMKSDWRGEVAYTYVDPVSGQMTDYPNLTFLAASTKQTPDEMRAAGLSKAGVQVAAVPSGMDVNLDMGVGKRTIFIPLDDTGAKMALPDGLLGAVSIFNRQPAGGYARVRQQDGLFTIEPGQGGPREVLQADGLQAYLNLVRLNPTQRANALDTYLLPGWINDTFLAAKTLENAYVVLDMDNPKHVLMGDPKPNAQAAIDAWWEIAGKKALAERDLKLAALEEERQLDAARKAAENAAHQQRFKDAQAAAAPCYAGVLAALEEGRAYSIPRNLLTWAFHADMTATRRADYVAAPPVCTGFEKPGTEVDWWSGALLQALPSDLIPDLAETLERHSEAMRAYDEIVRRRDLPGIMRFAAYLDRIGEDARAIDLYTYASDQGVPEAWAVIGTKLYYGYWRQLGKNEQLGYAFILEAERMGANVSVVKTNIEAAFEVQRRNQAIADWEAGQWKKFDFYMKCGFDYPDDGKEYICIE